MWGYFKLLGIGVLCFCALALLFGFMFFWSAALGFMLMIFCIPLALLLLAVCGIGAVFYGIHRARKMPGARVARIGVRCVAPVLLVLVVLVLEPLFFIGRDGVGYARLMLRQGQYETLIARAKSVTGQNGVSKVLTSGLVTYQIDYGPPVRLAFDAQGFAGNWTGIVWDPSHDVMLAKGFDENGHFLAPKPITMLFNGRLTGCSPLWGDYFMCAFT